MDEFEKYEFWETLYFLPISINKGTSHLKKSNLAYPVQDDCL